MVYIPSHIVTVLGRHLKRGVTLRVDTEIAGRLIIPTIVFDRPDREIIEDTGVVEFEGIGSRIISCNFDFHQDLMERDPKDIKCIDDEDYVFKFFSAIAFVRSIKRIQCRLEVSDDKLRGCELHVWFKKSPIHLKALLDSPSEGEFSAMAKRYFTAY